MKKLIAILTFCLASTAGVASAKIGGRNLESQFQVSRHCITAMTQTQLTAATVAGMNGTVVVESVVGLGSGALLTAGTEFDYYQVNTSTIPTLPYPAKLTYYLNDASSNNTLTCTNLKIEGTDQFGRAITFEDSTVTESLEVTSQVFATVSFWEATCEPGSTGDELVIGVDTEVGLQAKYSTFRDIESLTLADASDLDASYSAPSYCSGAGGVCAGTSDDIESALEKSTFSIDIATSNIWNVAVAGGDLVCWDIRHRKR